MYSRSRKPGCLMSLNLRSLWRMRTEIQYPEWSMTVTREAIEVQLRYTALPLRLCWLSIIFAFFFTLKSAEKTHDEHITQSEDKMYYQVRGVPPNRLHTGALTHTDTNPLSTTILSDQTLRVVRHPAKALWPWPHNVLWKNRVKLNEQPVVLIGSRFDNPSCL